MHTCTLYPYWKLTLNRPLLLLFFPASQIKAHQRLLKLSMWHFRPSVKRKWFMQISCSANTASTRFFPIINWPLQQSNYWKTLSPKITDPQSHLSFETLHMYWKHRLSSFCLVKCVYVWGFVRLTGWKWPSVIPLQCQTSSVSRAHTHTHSWLHCQLCFSDIFNALSTSG